MSKRSLSAVSNLEQEKASRLKSGSRCQSSKPVIGASNIHYEVSQRAGAIGCGGIGLVAEMVRGVGLASAIDEDVHVLKRHLPYHESDHVLNLAYNVMIGNCRLEDIELQRQNVAFLDALGAQMLPGSTTAGDFLRRVEQSDIEALMESVNTVRARVWGQSADRTILKRAIIESDASIVETSGECKQGMDMSYKGIWGYAPLLITLANTREVLYTVNRSGNTPSQVDCGHWINKAIDVVSPHAESILLRGDSAYSVTENFDAWDDRGIEFVYGMKAMPNLEKIANALPEASWSLLERPCKESAEHQRQRPDNVKEAIIEERGYKNLRLNYEEVAEFEYQPGKCDRPYRIVVVRKHINISKGQEQLFPEIRDFFYITNARRETPAEIVKLSNERCDQENIIEQMKNGVNALRLPVSDLLSNWAYMVIASLAWNLKSWLGLLMDDARRGHRLIRMEFRQFLQQIMLIPCQIIRGGRRLTFRLMAITPWSRDFLRLFASLRKWRRRGAIQNMAPI